MTLNALEALSPTQLAILIVVSAVAVLIVVGNIILSYFRHKNTERTLCTQQLQQKRNELLARLEEVKYRGSASESEAEEENTAPEEEEFEDYDVDDEEEETFLSAVSELPPMPQSEYGGNYEILAVKDMIPEMRAKYGLEGAAYRDKRYYVRYSYGFEAKLRIADPAVQKRYGVFVNEVGQYKGVRIKKSFRGQRICKGQTTLGLILFQGKTLCVAFALDPAIYAGTKYRGIDMSGSKRFINTPMLFKLTSDRMLEYAKYLLVQVASANTILLSDTPVERTFSFTPLSKEELFLMNSLRIRFMGEVPDSAQAEQPDAEPQEKTEQHETVE